MNTQWKEIQILNTTLFYRNYNNEKETRTFIITKDENSNFTLFISEKNIIKQIEKDIYSLNLAKLKCINLFIAKENNFIRDFLGEKFNSFIDFITKLQLSNTELDEIVFECKETEILKEEVKIKNECKENVKATIVDNKNMILSNIINHFKDKIFKNKKKISLFR